MVEPAPEAPPVGEPSPLSWLMLCGLLAGLLSAAVALVPLQGVAHVSDEVVYTLQAKLFSAGMRTGPPSENPSMFLYPFWVTDPVSYGAFPPGWPAFLSLGERLQLGWTINPLLSCTLPILLFGLAREWTDLRTARLTALISAVSPAVWILAGSRMAHTSVLVALAAASLVVVRNRDKTHHWAGAGAAIAYVVLARPFDAALIGLPLVIWACLRAPQYRHRVALISPIILAVIILAIDNYGLTGDPLILPIQQWSESWYTQKPGCDRLGIGESIGCLDKPHTLTQALSLTWDHAMRMDRTLIGIPGGLLLALGGLGLLRRLEPALLLLFVVGGYFFYWSPGAAYGARFWHPLMLVLPLGIAVLCLHIRDRWAPQAPLWAAGLVIGLCSTAGGSRLLPDLADSYWCVDGALAEHIDEAEIDEGILFVLSRGSEPISSSWPTLQVEDFPCDPMLLAGSALQLSDPTRQEGGIQVRHALPDPAQRVEWLKSQHPGVPAWLYTIDLTSSARSIERIEIDDDPGEPQEPSPR